MAEVFTVGHGDQELDGLFATLESAGIDVLLDVRSYPASRRFPQFNRNSIEGECQRRGVAYRWVEDLGGKPRDRALWLNDETPDYKAMAERPEFASAIDKVVIAAEKHRVALLCSETRPERCHRALLLTAPLVDRGVLVRHLLPQARVLEEVAASRRML